MKTVKQTIRNLVVGVFLVFGVAFAALPMTARAADCVETSTTQCCGNVPTSIIGCDQNNKDKDGDGKVDAQETGIWALLMMGVNILTAGIGVVALAGIVYGAVLYTSAGGSTEQIKKAYTVFTNVGIGIVAFAGMWALLNFLIPGGAFNAL